MSGSVSSVLQDPNRAKILIGITQKVEFPAGHFGETLRQDTGLSQADFDTACVPLVQAGIIIVTYTQYGTASYGNFFKLAATVEIVAKLEGTEVSI